MNRRSFAVGAALLVLVMLGSAAPVKADCKPLKSGETVVNTGESFKQYAIWRGEGESSVLGAFTSEYLVHGTGNGEFISLGTLVAANGDTLFTITEGELVAPGVWEGTTVIVGGTGRFEGATGGGQFTLTLVEPGVVDIESEGEICLP